MKANYPKLCLLFLAVCLVADAAAGGQGRARVALQGVVLTLYGRNAEHSSIMPGVEVGIRGDRLNTVAVTDMQGRFRFEVPPGRYRLSFVMTGFYPLIVDDVLVEEEPLEGLIVALTNRHQTPHPLVIGPEIVSAPDLQVGMEIAPDPVRGKNLTGNVKITNNGDAPVALPSTPWPGGEPPAGVLLMNVVVEASFVGLGQPVRLAFNGWFYCRPEAVDCMKVQPGGSLDVPVTLFTQASLGSSAPQLFEYRASGTLEGRISLDLVLPQESVDTGRVLRTEPVTADFRLPIRLP